MKLDEIYFLQKFVKLSHQHNKGSVCSWDEIEAVKVLKQIARDAAEAQRERCFNAEFACQKEGCTDCFNALTIPDGE